MYSLFRFTSFNDSIDRGDVRNITSMKEMFSSASRFYQSLSTWDVGRVSNMERMFHSSLLYNQPLASWNGSQVKTMTRMFVGASSFHPSLSTWNVSRVTDMAEYVVLGQVVQPAAGHVGCTSRPLQGETGGGGSDVIPTSVARGVAKSS